jgi:hypothetical protein
VGISARILRCAGFDCNRNVTIGRLRTWLSAALAAGDRGKALAVPNLRKKIRAGNTRVSDRNKTWSHNDEPANWPAGIEKIQRSISAVRFFRFGGVPGWRLSCVPFLTKHPPPVPAWPIQHRRRHPLPRTCRLLVRSSPRNRGDAVRGCMEFGQVRRRPFRQLGLWRWLCPSHAFPAFSTRGWYI